MTTGKLPVDFSVEGRDAGLNTASFLWLVSSLKSFTYNSYSAWYKVLLFKQYIKYMSHEFSQIINKNGDSLYR
jgi:hypothetical protein